MRKYEKNYIALLENVLTNGTLAKGTPRTDNYAISNVIIKLNLVKEAFPILSCQKYDIKKHIVNIIGLLRGQANSDWYRERGYHGWKKMGLSEDVYKQVRREDSDLANLYCSENGKHPSRSKEYIERFKALNTVSFNEGLALIDKAGIPFYKDVVIKKKGELGPIHGYLWRHWPHHQSGNFDQLAHAFNELKENPDNQHIFINSCDTSAFPQHGNSLRENIIKGKTAYYPSQIGHEYMTCSIPLSERVELYNTKVTEEEHKLSETTNDIDMILKAANIPSHYLDLYCFQRHWEIVTALPADIMEFTLMLSMMAKLQNMIPRYLTVNASSVYLSVNHLNGVNELLQRDGQKNIPVCYPVLEIKKRPDVRFIDQFEPADFTLKNYKCLDEVKFPVIL